MFSTAKFGLIAACVLAPLGAGAQTANNMAVLNGLAPVAALANTPAGQAALAANLTVTAGIQTGALRQTTLLPFADQRQQALKDAFITGGDLADLADGLGTTLGAAYLARAHYRDREHFTSLSPAIADLIAYTGATTGSDSNSGKYFFANLTIDGKTPVSGDAAAILKAIGGAPDVFGRAYGRPAGGPGADAYGNSRPFQTEPVVAAIAGPDYFNVPSDNATYNRGPIIESDRQPVLSERPQHLRLCGIAGPGGAGARTLSADDRPGRRIRQRSHHRGRSLCDGRDRRADFGDLRRRASARQ